MGIRDDHHTPSTPVVPKQDKTPDLVELPKGISDFTVRYHLSCDWFVGGFLTTPTNAEMANVGG